MEKVYNVSIELQADADEIIQVRYFNYMISANCSASAINKGFEEIYKDESNYNREVLAIHLNKIDILMAQK